MMYVLQTAGAMYINSSAGGTLSGVTPMATLNIEWGTGNLNLINSTTTKFQITPTLIVLGGDTLQFAAVITTTCVINQGNTGGNIPRSMLIQAQTTTSTGTVTPNLITLAGGDNTATPVGTATAGNTWVRGGAALGGSGTRNSGNLYLSGGHVGGGGSTTVGFTALTAADNTDPTAQTVRLKVNGIGLGLYTAAPVAQAARVGQATNSTGVAAVNKTMSDVTTAGLADPAKVNLNFANIVENMWNLMETAIHNIGLTA
jgi:hypothetical protein